MARSVLVRLASIVTLTCVVAIAAGCADTTCEQACDALAADCDGGDAATCSGDCQATETACETCFGCLRDQGACEIEPAGPCQIDCTGCRGH